MTEKLPVHENVRVAFSGGWNRTAQKTMIAFANTLGGNLYLGRNKEGTATGLSKKDVQRISRALHTFCAEETDPVMLDLVSTKVMAADAGGYLLRATVLPGEDRPYAFKGQRYTGGAYVRDGSVTVTATEEELREMIRDSASESRESRLSRRTDLTFGEAAAVFRKYNVDFSPAHLRHLRLADDNGHFTLLGELLSDQNRTRLVIGIFSRDAASLSAHMLGELLSDQNRTRLVIGIFSRDAASLSAHTLSGSLLRQIDRAFDLFAEMNPEIFHKTDGLANRHYFAWPPKALREALVNCAVHRDYAEPELTKVSVFPNRFEFLSYGSIPGRLSVEDIVLEGVSKCRNEHLAVILRRLGWMENYGSGFPMIWREYANSGAEPKLEATRRVFRIVLPRIHDDSRGALKERCRVLFENRDMLAMADVMSLLNISRTSANSAVNALLKDGLIQKIGNGRTTRYRSLLR